MAKGYLAGAIWGLVASTLGAGALSLAMGPPPGAERIGAAPADGSAPAAAERPLADVPDDPASEALPGARPDVAPGTGPETDPAAGSSTAPGATATPLSDTPPVRFEQTDDTAPQSAPPPAPARRPGAETDVAEPQVAPLAAPQDDPDSALPDTATAPGALPDAALGSDAPPLPDTSTSGGGVAVTTESPVLPSVQAALPDAPGAERDPSVATQPAQPPQPAVPTERSGLVEDPAPGPAAKDGPEAAPATEPQAREDAPATQAPTPQPRIRVLPPPEDTAQATDRPGIGTPGTSLIDRSPAVAEGRLPTVGSPADTLTDQQGPAEQAGQAEGTRPLEAHATPVAVAEGAARIAIVLIDDGSGPLGPDAFDGFPFPVSFALDPTRPGATQRMQGYRARGFEVLALASVPEGAQPTDVEVALQASLSAVPEAVGVLEAPDQGLQGSRAVSDQVAAALRDTGHGLVLQDNGLNTAASLAAREGVPVATIFKDFDGAGQDARAIRRFLEGAAFRARRDGTAVVMGRLSPDTLSAVLLWGLQDRSGQLALVPVSQALRAADQ